MLKAFSGARVIMNPVFTPSPVNKSFPNIPLLAVVSPEIMVVPPPPLLPVMPENIREFPSAETTTDCPAEPKLEGVSERPVKVLDPPPPSNIDPL
ncbi:MAG: hypothetical protein CMD25_04145 [Flavobacteriales bacterium]|nr:hypothetical protein [Flavobacteriales bacterium]